MQCLLHIWSGHPSSGSFENSAFFETANGRARSLLHTFGETQGVALLTVDAAFDYKIDFDWNDLDRWKITKVDGASGIQQVCNRPTSGALSP